MLYIWRTRFAVALILLAIFAVGRVVVSPTALISIETSWSTIGMTFPSAHESLTKKGFLCGDVMHKADQETLTCDRKLEGSDSVSDQFIEIQFGGTDGMINRAHTHICQRNDPVCPNVLRHESNELDESMGSGRRQKPADLSVRLAVSVFAFIASLWVSVNWRHYIQLWLGKDPDIQGNAALGLRLFFGLCLVGSVSQIWQMLAYNDWMATELKQSLTLTLVMLAVGIGFDFALRIVINRVRE